MNIIEQCIQKLKHWSLSFWNIRNSYFLIARIFAPFWIRYAPFWGFPIRNPTYHLFFLNSHTARGDLYHLFQDFKADNVTLKRPGVGHATTSLDLLGKVEEYCDQARARTAPIQSHAIYLEIANNNPVWFGNKMPCDALSCSANAHAADAKFAASWRFPVPNMPSGACCLMKPKRAGSTSPHRRAPCQSVPLLPHAEV